MKNLFKLFPIAAVAVSSFFFMGCPQDACVTKKITCANDGVCLDGLCTCADGYEGELCETASRTKMLYATYAITGSYAVTTCGVAGATTDYTAGAISAITEGAKVNEIKISNFSKSGAQIIVTATVKGNAITVAKQSVGGSEFTGAGTINPTTKVITYTYTQRSLTPVPCGTSTGEESEAGTVTLTR